MRLRIRSIIACTIKWLSVVIGAFLAVGLMVGAMFGWFMVFQNGPHPKEFGWVFEFFIVGGMIVTGYAILVIPIIAVTRAIIWAWENC